MINVIAVGLGAFIGANARYALTKITPLAQFPFSTLMANVIAGFLIGIIIEIDRSASPISAKWKLFLNTGFLGGLSTFSTFSLETVDLFNSGKYVSAATNVALNISLSIFGVILGMTLVKLILAPNNCS